MRHHVDKRKLNRTTSHRKAMLANMATSLVLHDRIETTLPKAKELRRVADRLVTLGKRKSLHARRQAIAMIRDKKAVSKLFDDLATRFADRKGGYTRILKLGYRHGDAAPMAIIEYLPSEHHKEEAKAPPKKAKAKKPVSKKEKVEKKAEKKPAAKKAKATTSKKKTEKKKTKKRSKTTSKKSTKSK